MQKCERMRLVPRFIEKAPADPQGLRTEQELPYSLRSQDVMRTVEDLHDLLHEVDSMLHEKGFDRMEELLDPAGFSGFLSRSTVDCLDRLSRTLVRNTYHNGYPDLLPSGFYPGDSVQHGTQGGLEVKASRSSSSWQAHGPREGWFCVVQFAIDKNESKALRDREPTRVLAMMIGQLTKEDWSWQPAKTGRIRSGTASVRPSGIAKLRANAAWVDSSYEAEHEERLLVARRKAWCTTSAKEDCLHFLREAGKPVKAVEVAEAVASKADLPLGRLRSSVNSTLKKLVASGAARKPRRGLYEPGR